MKIGLVGLGRMGSAIAQRLREHSFDVVGWDQNSNTNKMLAKSGLRIGTTPRDIAGQCDVVLSIRSLLSR